MLETNRDRPQAVAHGCDRALVPLGKAWPRRNLDGKLVPYKVLGDWSDER